MELGLRGAQKHARLDPGSRPILGGVRQPHSPGTFGIPPTTTLAGSPSAWQSTTFKQRRALVLCQPRKLGRANGNLPRVAVLVVPIVSGITAAERAILRNMIGWAGTVKAALSCPASVKQG